MQYSKLYFKDHVLVCNAQDYTLNIMFLVCKAQEYISNITFLVCKAHDFPKYIMQNCYDQLILIHDLKDHCHVLINGEFQIRNICVFC